MDPRILQKTVLSSAVLSTALSSQKLSLASSDSSTTTEVHDRSYFFRLAFLEYCCFELVRSRLGL